MLGLIKSLPLLLLVAGAAYAAHTFIVGQLESRISQQEATIQQYMAQNTALQMAAEQNERTIRSIEAQFQQQQQLMGNLSQANQALQAEKDEYLSIFRRHDLQRLALARPGLIEPRLNSGTADVFRQLEADSREVAGVSDE
jgi:flagellar motor protein MotB